MGNIVQGSILGDQPPQFAQDLDVPQDMEFSVLKLGKSQEKWDTLVTVILLLRPLTGQGQVSASDICLTPPTLFLAAIYLPNTMYP